MPLLAVSASTTKPHHWRAKSNSTGGKIWSIFFGFGAGAIELCTALGDLPEQYYLLQSEDGDALVTITKDKIYSREINHVDSKRRFMVNNYIYSRTSKPIAK